MQGTVPRVRTWVTSSGIMGGNREIYVFGSISTILNLGGEVLETLFGAELDSVGF